MYIIKTNQQNNIVTMNKIQSLHHILYDSLPSTQDYCKTLIQSGSIIEDGTVVRAKIQTNGRGRDGRKWLDTGSKNTVQENIAMTIVLHTANSGMQQNGFGGAKEAGCSLTYITQLPFLIAVAIGETMTSCGDLTNIEMHYKWVNDVLLNKRKVAGILLEYIDPGHLLIGIGVNIVNSPINAALQASSTKNFGATSLFEEGIIVSAEQFLKTFDIKFVTIYNAWLQYGFARFKNLWMARAFCINELVQVKTISGSYEGVLTGIDEVGKMLLKINEHEIKEIMEGSMEKAGVIN